MSKIKKNILLAIAFVVPLFMTAVLLYFMNRIAGADVIVKYVDKINSSVINQAIFIFAIWVYGLCAMLLFNKHIGRLAIVFMAFVIGTLLWCLASVVVVCIGIVFTWYTVAIVCLLFLAVLYIMLKPKLPQKEDMIFYAKSVLLFVSLSLFFAALCVFRFSYDSYMYINAGMTIAKFGYLPSNLIDIVSGFSLFTSMLYAPAVFFNFDFSQGVNLLLNASFTIFVGYAVYETLKDRVKIRIAIIAAALSILTLLSCNIYFETIYWPLSNMLTAMTLFGFIYFAYKASKENSKSNMILSAIFSMSFVLIRSENMLLYICVMFLLSLYDIDKKHLSLHVLSAACALALWYFRFFATAGLDFSEGAFLTIERAVGLIGVFVLFILYILFLSKSKFISDRKKQIQILFFAAMASAIVLLGLLKPDFFAENTTATLVNVFYDGSWAGSLLIVFCMYLIKLFYQEKTDIYDKTIFVFILFYAIIFLLRAMVLRVGYGDSGNRYFVHILPVAVYSLATWIADRTEVYKK